MIDIRKLKELVRLMVSNDLTEIDLRDSEEQVTLRRAGVNVAPQIVHAAPVHVPVSAHAAPVAVASAAPSGAAAAPPADEAGLIKIESPMVGTFYTSPNPDSPAFVDVGTKVGAETVVCIIEAMKIFNEIKAECSGTIQRVLVKNGQAVEFGQPLFLVKPE
ncbi:MAG TPA: acetyl-CoA carboxylase biotin carboxyl carrier protein [Phycisphaerales bacterium]|nr:acetyl-CoA carboxylase biotin carboxyl carrier protein [Phycisphaerales bacterium]HRQ76315.1 acetyl-CoA carboxylase biotin carboxyl carrier protein [Phycisphaerales bacterium]